MLFGKRKKSNDAFGEQALEHLDALYGTALRLTKNKAEAEDLVQDTYLRAIRFQDKFELGTNIRAWLFKMMFNLFINKCRRDKRGRQIREGYENQDLIGRILPDRRIKSSSKPEEYFFERLMSDDVVKALDELQHDFKMVVLLADVNGFSYSQIAEILGIPVGTVMSRLHRGRRGLRDALYHFAVAEGYVKAPTEDSELQQPADLESYRKRKKSAGEGS